MNILFLCKTPYQIMTAIRIKEVFYRSDNTDLVIFDTIANYNDLISRAEDCCFFKNVYAYHARELVNSHGFNKIVQQIKYTSTFKPDVNYDVIFFANVYDWIENEIISELAAKSSAIKIFMYEDGFATYSNHYGDFIKMIKEANGFKKMYYKKIYSEYFKIEGLFVYSPELVQWCDEFVIREIPKITSSDALYIQVINKIFGYETMKDSYKQDVIFFEESYYADGNDIGDTNIIDSISKAIDRNNIFVKIHPRNSVNRFKEHGYTTNTNTEIPWEVIALNIGIEDKILITIASGSALTSLINMSSKPKKIMMLMNCEEIDDKKLTPTRYLLRKIASSHQDIVSLPERIDEALNILKNEV